MEHKGCVPSGINVRVYYIIMRKLIGWDSRPKVREVSIGADSRRDWAFCT